MQSMTIHRAGPLRPACRTRERRRALAPEARPTGSVTRTGIIYNLRRCAEGFLLLATGRLIVSGDFTTTLVSSGHTIPIEEQDAAVCAALA
jgi:hypothetical protein